VFDARFEPAAAPLSFGAFFCLMGLIFGTLGALRVRRARSWSRTIGIVVTRRHGSTTGMGERYPTFKWRDQHGTDHEHTSNVYSSLGPRPGTEVPVLFDPDNPSRAVIDSFVQSGRIFVVIGTGMLAVAAVLLVVGGVIFLRVL